MAARGSSSLKKMLSVEQTGGPCLSNHDEEKLVQFFGSLATGIMFGDEEGFVRSQWPQGARPEGSRGDLPSDSSWFQGAEWPATAPDLCPGDSVTSGGDSYLAKLTAETLVANGRVIAGLRASHAFSVEYGPFFWGG